MEIKLEGCVFDVDLPRTKTYYETNEVCGCAYCRHFRENVRQQYPKLTELLARFGVDAARPDETEPIELDRSILFTAVHYTVCGSAIEPADREAVLRTEEMLRICLERGDEKAPSFPNSQREPYFCVSVWNLSLPCEWAADPDRSAGKGILSGVKRLLHRGNDNGASRV